MLFQKVDAVLLRVPDLDRGLDLYSATLGHELLWRRADAAGLRLGDSELVLSTTLDPETDLLVESVDAACRLFAELGGTVEVGPEDIPVGRVAVVTDPFGNRLTLVDLSKGEFRLDGGPTNPTVGPWTTP
jgi:catechol 2,3-dioxygenase-like lactoylglutathione lyase family enzyme